jgi:hypothetical protein
MAVDSFSRLIQWYHSHVDPQLLNDDFDTDPAFGFCGSCSQNVTDPCVSISATQVKG